MKVDAERYRIVPSRTFWIWWLAYCVPALFLYLGIGPLMAAGDVGFYVVVFVGFILILAILAVFGYTAWMGIQSVRTSVYPPPGFLVLSTWNVAEGLKARISGFVVAVLASVAVLGWLWIVGVTAWAHWGNS